MENVVLDTDVLIDFLRNKEDAFLLMEELKGENIATTAVNAFELFWGAYRIGQVNPVVELLDSLVLLHTTKEAMQEAGRIAALLDSKGIQINVGDLLVGAICKMNRFSIVTNNKEHFSRIDGLKMWNRGGLL